MINGNNKGRKKDMSLLIQQLPIVPMITCIMPTPCFDGYKSYYNTLKLTPCVFLCLLTLINVAVTISCAKSLIKENGFTVSNMTSLFLLFIMKPLPYYTLYILTMGMTPNSPKPSAHL